MIQTDPPLSLKKKFLLTRLSGEFINFPSFYNNIPQEYLPANSVKARIRNGGVISLFLEALRKGGGGGGGTLFPPMQSSLLARRIRSRVIPTSSSSITIFLPAIKGCTSPSAYQHSIPPLENLSS